MTIHENIRKYRESKGMTLEELGKRIGVSKQTVARYESGVITNIPYDKISLLAKVFGVSESVLMGWDFPFSEIQSLQNNFELKPVSPKKTSGKKNIKKTSEIASLAGQVNILELLNAENETLIKSKEIIDGALRKVFSDEQIQSFWYIMNQDVYAKAFINYYNESVKKKKFELEQKIKEMQEELKKLDS